MTAAAFAELSNQVAVVTGASSGIGRAIALELAAAGAAVVVHAGASQSRAEAVAQEIMAHGGRAVVEMGDLADPNTRQRLFYNAWRWQGAVDIWVNNAGADLLTGEAAGWPFDKKLERLWQVDVSATIDLSRCAGRAMAERGSGVILNMGWDQAEIGMAGDSGELFAAAKGAIMAFSRSLARSVAPAVRVNCLAPGWIRTAWGERASPYWQDRAIDECLRGRWGTPDDVARVARFLASASADFVTAQVINVNGGYQ